MSKTETQDSGMIVIPLKEYNYLKSVVNKIGKKLNSESDPDFLTPAQLKRVSEIDEKVKQGDYSDFVDFDEMKSKILNKRISNVRLKNRKKSRKVY